MAVMVLDSNTQAFKDAETPKIWDATAGAWKESNGLVWDAQAQAWKEVWSPMPDKIYLYNRGDECVDVTGGWRGSTVTVDNSGSNNEYYKKCDHLNLISYSYSFYPLFWTGDGTYNSPSIYIPKGYKVGILADWKISFYQEDNPYTKTPNTGLFEFGFITTRYGDWLLKGQTSIWANIGKYHTTVYAEFGQSVLYTAPSTEDMNGHFKVNVRYSSERSTRDTTINLKIYEIWLERQKN